ncbi:MAG TPA: hypothetical protein VMA31_05225 [Bryobacteraceae bacterium]|nr:hypothetical protein [Bryobacteraceae bacterium]
MMGTRGHIAVTVLALACGWMSAAGAGRPPQQAQNRSAAGPDLKQAQAEPNLDKRSKLALESADTAFETMKAAYEKGENTQVAAAATEIQQSVELAYTSLTQTGKDPRKSPKWFKRAEIQTRDLLRRLDSFQHDMSFGDRSMLDSVKTSVQQVHDNLLMGLMEGKHK